MSSQLTEQYENKVYRDRGTVNSVPTVEEPHNPTDPWGWVKKVLEKAPEAYRFTGGLWHEEMQDGTWKVYSEVVYVMNLESRRYTFSNPAPEILIFSHPVNDPEKPAQWGLILVVKEKMIVRTYDAKKGAKIAANNFLRRYESPYGNSVRKNTWSVTSQVAEKGKRIDALIEKARREIGG